MTEQDCIFCKIGRGEIPSDLLYDDGVVFAIRDINPKAPTHLLVIPHRHVGVLAGGHEDDLVAASHCLSAAPGIAAGVGLAHDGYRLVANQGEHSGQEVPHFHLHILGGHPLGAMG